MRPQLEHLPRDSRTSWSLLFRQLPEIPFLWHYHPEFELTLTLNARGQRYVGDHLADFEPGDLVLVGPNIAHTWSARERVDDSQPMRAIVAWFTADWARQLMDVVPELADVSRFFDRAAGAVKFSEAVARDVAMQLVRLQALAPIDRVPVILDVLVRLSHDTAAQPLTLAARHPADQGARARLGKVLDVLHQRWIDPPSASELSATAALSTGAFHRFFKRHVGCSALDYVARLRIGRACQRLIETELPIGLIAAEVGYASLAQFNRQFRALKAQTPGELRRKYRREQALAALPAVRAVTA